MVRSGPSQAVAPESLRKEDRILARADFQRCYRQGRRRSTGLLTLHRIESAAGRPRLGITATRKVGGAVVRQRLRRRVREIYRRWPRRRELPDLDLVVHLRPAAARAPFAELRDELESLLSQLDRRQGGRRA